MKTKKKLKVLMAAAEAAPLIKVGGLSDVVGSLPKALSDNGCDVRIIMPKYDKIDIDKYKFEKTKTFQVDINEKKDEVSVWQSRKAIAGATVYLIESKMFDSSDVYIHKNDPARFILFSTLCLEVMPVIGFKPDVLHCHDYHTAFILPLIKTGKYQYLEGVKTLYTIHNLNYQGKSDEEVLGVADLTHNSLVSLAEDMADGDINFMVQGIINADAVNTVSPTYAREITTKEYSAGLEKIVRANKNKLYGIINGIDLKFFDPSKDKYISRKYSINNIEKKIENKLDLQRAVGLPEDKDVAVAGFISRFVSQKGIELINDEVVKNSNCQFVFLGTGRKEYEEMVAKLARKYPEKVSANIMFDIGLAQKIYAGSDIFLMPSRFEPCGLGQMISMRYGTVVVARATGGLKDTIDDKVGFVFSSFSPKALKKSLKECLDVYYNYPNKWLKLKKNCLKKDFSWNKSAKEYLRLYKKLIKES